MRAVVQYAVVLSFFCILVFACSQPADHKNVPDGSSVDDTDSNPGPTDPDDTSAEIDSGENVPDLCPENPEKTEPGFCGCNSAEGTCCDTIRTGFVKTIGAEYFFYGRPFSDNLDIDGLTPDESKTVQIIQNQTIEPATTGDSFSVLKGFIKIDQGGLYTFRPGYDHSTFNVMTINGQEIHRKNLGDSNAIENESYLSAGFHPFRIVFFKTINPLAIWQNGNRMNEKHLWHETPFTTERENEILDIFGSLRDHINGDTALNDQTLASYSNSLSESFSTFSISPPILLSAHQLVEIYENIIGPLWIGEQTANGFNRNEWNLDIHKIVFDVMQAILDYGYSTPTVGKCAEILAGKGFRTAEYFPGKVTSIPDPGLVHRSTVNASYVKTFGHPVMHGERPARKPTGTYLPPGSVATVRVPESLANKGYAIRVGAHSWDLSHRPPVQRLDRVSLIFDIASRQTQIANPLGGGIYLEVPFLADEGVVELEIQNAVRSPYFSSKSFHTTSLSEWQNIERNHGAPWADFQSEKFMMNLPTSWIYNLENPVTLMQSWDQSMDAMNDLMGYPHLGGKETMYPQVDVILRSSVHAPGYPSINQKYNPTTDYGGKASSHLVTGPQSAPDYEFHEQGHVYLFVKYGGEQESTVNLLHVAVWHQKFGYSLDEAFRKSRGFSNEYRTLETTAIAWMTSFNFSPRKVPMASGEKSYQLKGHAKFVDIARLFGWEVLGNFWYSINEDYENGAEWSKHGTAVDQITLRLCQKANVDLRPLLHFWGIHPENGAELGKKLADANLPPSAKIYDTLIRYKSLAPRDNGDFQDFAQSWWGKQPSINGYWTESEHARQWDSTEHLDKWDPPIRPNGEIYDEAAALAVENTVQEIIDLYFPHGRP